VEEFNIRRERTTEIGSCACQPTLQETSDSIAQLDPVAKSWGWVSGGFTRLASIKQDWFGDAPSPEVMVPTELHCSHAHTDVAINGMNHLASGSLAGEVASQFGTDLVPSMHQLPGTGCSPTGHFGAMHQHVYEPHICLDYSEELVGMGSSRANSRFVTMMENFLRQPLTDIFSSLSPNDRRLLRPVVALLMQDREEEALRLVEKIGQLDRLEQDIQWGRWSAYATFASPPNDPLSREPPGMTALLTMAKSLRQEIESTKSVHYEVSL
jgi:hypothetical protein